MPMQPNGWTFAWPGWTISLGERKKLRADNKDLVQY